MKIIEFGRDWLLKHVISKLPATPPHLNLLPLEHEDHSVLSAIYVFRDSINFFVCLHHILQLGDDLWPHSQEGYEKPKQRISSSHT